MNPLNAFRNYSGRKVFVSLNHHHQTVTERPVFQNIYTHTEAYAHTYTQVCAFKFTENDKYIKLNFLIWYLILDFQK